MSFAASSDFVAASERAFASLVSVYGFDPPVVDHLGREVFVLYHKDNRTVSVSMESGARPFVELFYPSSDTGEASQAWARRNGVDRSRRIPRLRKADWSSHSLEVQLESAFLALEDEELDFLRQT